MSAPLDKKPYGQIVRLAERFLDERQLLCSRWLAKSQKDADARYRVMLDVLKEERGQKVTLLDFGCGASHLSEYYRRVSAQMWNTADSISHHGSWRCRAANFPT